MCANTLRGFAYQPFPKREKGELSLEFCYYKDTFGVTPFLIKEHDFSYRERDFSGIRLEMIRKNGFRIRS